MLFFLSFSSIYKSGTMFQNSLLSFKSPGLCPYLYTLSLWAIFPPSLITIKCTHTLTAGVTLYREWTLTALLTYFLLSLLLYKLLPQKLRHSITYPHFLFYSVYKWMKLKWSIQFPIIYHAWLLLFLISQVMQAFSWCKCCLSISLKCSDYILKLNGLSSPLHIHLHQYTDTGVLYVPTAQVSRHKMIALLDKLGIQWTRTINSEKILNFHYLVNKYSSYFLGSVNC